MPRRVGVERIEFYAELTRRCDLGTCPVELRLRAGEYDGPADRDVSIDALGGGHPHHLCHRLAHRGVLRGGRIVSVLARQRRGTHREQCRAPAPVAPGCAEAGVLLLDNCHVQRRVSAEQVVRRPQSGEAGTDDDDVRARVAGRPSPARSGPARPQCAQPSTSVRLTDG